MILENGLFPNIASTIELIEAAANFLDVARNPDANLTPEQIKAKRKDEDQKERQGIANWLNLVRSQMGVHPNDQQLKYVEKLLTQAFGAKSVEKRLELINRATPEWNNFLSRSKNKSRTR